ncbi:armadillo-type protein [Suillus paluster]|uniref:armadillo-type protein n=1 Tax=Suillus paluster TaxID=48578 RepID=UPI001B870A1E|nr:armadillo-type protein [Suillus paluster]KAG1717980.1 armadillo-type protein [Suillus paluster]
MDYLRSFGSAAVSTLVQKSGLNLPFSLGPKVYSCETFWTLYDATKREDGSLVSVFEYDLTHPLNKSTIPLARNSLRKLRTIRHPDVLRFIDVVESDSAICIMTERVRPLPLALSNSSSNVPREREDWLIWGLHRISVALAFLNDSASSTHGNVRPNAIFITPSGEWKLGGFEVLSNPKDDLSVIYTMGGLMPDAMACAPPEVKKEGWSVLRDVPISAADAYALGLLLHSVFNPTHPPPPTAQPPHPPPQPSSKGAIPSSVFPSFKKLLNPNPKLRMSPKNLLDIGMTESDGEGHGFFVHNRLVKVCAGLDGFTLSSESDKASLLRTLKESGSSFPPEFVSYRVLPCLVSALEFGGASAATIVPLVLQFGKNVAPDDYTSVIVAPLVKLFASADRGTRIALLDSLPDFAEKLDKKTVVDKIWPNLQTGFTDTVAVIREATVRAVVLLSPKLSDRILNNELLRHLARLQSDPEASIRTNTCILIGRLGPSLGYNTKRKVLVPAFSMALKDQFVHARVAGVMAFMATAECFEVEDVAGRVVPAVVGATLDKEKLVRDQAFKAVELFIKRLEAHASTMPETASTEEGENDLPARLPGAFTQAGLVNSATGAAAALTGWAVSSLGKKVSLISPLEIDDLERYAQLAPADLQTTMTSTIDGSTSAPTINGHNSPLFRPPASSASPSGNPSRGKGLQLGGNKAPPSALAAQLAEEAANETGQGSNRLWNDDLIDINADEGDWSAFESAPAIIEPKPMSATNGLGFGISLRASPSYQHSPLLQALDRHPYHPLDPLPNTADSAQPTNMAGLSKEEKAAEMARRKEERRLRIEKLKEQKKNAAAAGKA